MKYNPHSVFRLSAAMALAALIALPVIAASKNKLDARVRDLTDYFDKLEQDPTKAVPAEILSKAEGLIVMRSYKAGFIIGVEGAHGVAIVKNKETGKWGPVGFVRGGEGSFGFQAGAQRSDLVFVLMNSSGLGILTDPNLKIGVDLRVTAGPVSAGDQANFKLNDTPILVYGDTKGLFGGASLQTGGVFPDEGDNEEYYDKKLTLKQIVVDGAVPPTDAAQRLASTIEKYSKSK